MHRTELISDIHVLITDNEHFDEAVKNQIFNTIVLQNEVIARNMCVMMNILVVVSPSLSLSIFLAFVRSIVIIQYHQEQQTRYLCKQIKTV